MELIELIRDRSSCLDVAGQPWTKDKSNEANLVVHQGVRQSTIIFGPRTAGGAENCPQLDHPLTQNKVCSFASRSTRSPKSNQECRDLDFDWRPLHDNTAAVGLPHKSADIISNLGDFTQVHTGLIEPNPPFDEAPFFDPSACDIDLGTTVPPSKISSKLGGNTFLDLDHYPTDYGLNSLTHEPTFDLAFKNTVQDSVSNTDGAPASNVNPGNTTATDNGRTPCPICPVTVKRKYDLRRHMLKHQDGARKFHCPMTGCKYQGTRGFGRKDKLVDHIRARHPELPV